MPRPRRQDRKRIAPPSALPHAWKHLIGFLLMYAFGWLLILLAMLPGGIIAVVQHRQHPDFWSMLLVRTLVPGAVTWVVWSFLLRPLLRMPCPQCGRWSLRLSGIDTLRETCPLCGYRHVSSGGDLPDGD